MKGILHVSPSGRHGVIYEDTEVKYVVDFTKDKPELEEPGNTHIGMWMQGGPVEVIDADEHPYTLALLVGKRSCIMDRVSTYLRDCLLSAELTVDLRRRASQLIEAQMDDEVIAAHLRKIAETMEIPVNADFSVEFTGKVGELVAIIKRRHSAGPTG